MVFHWKIRFLGGVTKNKYTGGNWTACKFKGGGGLIPQCTLSQILEHLLWTPHLSRYWLYRFNQKNLYTQLPFHHLSPPTLVWNFFKVNKKMLFRCLWANFEQTSYIAHASIAYFVHYLLGWHCKTTYVWRQPLTYVTKISCYYILHLQRKIA